MKHTPSPIYESKSGRTTLSLVFTILITGGIFIILPLTQVSSQPTSICTGDDGRNITVTPPPKYDPPPIPDKKDDPIDDNPELIPEHKPLSLSDMNILYCKQSQISGLMSFIFLQTYPYNGYVII
jgi:hypothetical protein